MIGQVGGEDKDVKQKEGWEQGMQREEDEKEGREREGRRRNRSKKKKEEEVRYK